MEADEEDGAGWCGEESGLGDEAHLMSIFNDCLDPTCLFASD